jgi:uracil-DNA glycosylase
MTSVQAVIEESWKKALSKEFESQYFAELKQFLIDERSKYRIYPAGSKIFNAFDLTPITKVKVVIIGQDPYHGPGQAHGLCFSVPDGIYPPPSLVNIFKELRSDLNIETPKTGNLEKWAKQGVLLLNATLTVREAQAGSHQGKGWERFTDAAIRAVSDNCSRVVFILWGNFAQAKAPLIDTSRHFILKGVHPSPLSASRGFFGCKHFSQANLLLKEAGVPEIDWSL